MNTREKRRPRPYQKKCLKKLNKKRAQGATKALVVMASGTGKTLTCIFDLKGYLRRNPQARVLVLCHSAAILEQTRDEFRAMLGDEYSYGMYNGFEKPTQKTDFLFANFQSMNAHAEEDFLPDEFQYIAVDEAHHSPAKTYRRAIEYFRPQFLLGLTATPKRTDDADIRDIFGKQVFTYTMEEAVNDGWLSAIDYRVRLDDLMKILTVLDSDEPVTMAQLNRDFFIPKRDKEIVRLIRECMAEQKDPTVSIFCQNIKSANHFAELMGDAIVIHSRLKDEKLVAERLAKFRSGEAKIVCSVNMLNEGIDVPRTDIVVFLRATDSKIIFTQQMGRGLRLADGKDKVVVLDFVATADRLKEIFEAERKFKETSKRYPTKGKGDHECFTLNIDTPEFSNRKVDILKLIKKAEECSKRYTRVYTDEELLEFLRKKACDLGRTPTMTDVDDDPNMPHSDTYAKRFGGFPAALVRAGLPVNRLRMSDEEMLGLLLVKADELGRTPTSEDVDNDPRMPHPGTYAERFGSFTKALLMVGLRPSQWKGLSDEELLEMLRAKARDLGRTPTMKDVDDDPNMPSFQMYISRFGSFTEALERAGLELTCSRRWTRVSDAKLLELLVEKAEELGRMPTRKDVNDDPNMPSSASYARRFGSFTKALELVGFGSIRHRQRWTNEEMLAALVKKSGELGRTPRMEDVDNDPDMPSTVLYLERFGSFVKAVELAGLHWNDYRIKWTDAELLDMLQFKAHELGRAPSVREIDNDPNMPSSTTYKGRFKSFARALELAGLELTNDKKWKKVSDEELLSLLVKKAEKLGRTPTKREVDVDPDMPSVGVYVRRFGSFAKALELAGLELGKHQKKRSSKKGGKKASG